MSIVLLSSSQFVASDCRRAICHFVTGFVISRVTFVIHCADFAVNLISISIEVTLPLFALIVRPVKFSLLTEVAFIGHDSWF